jgi:hypothetical protein
VQALIRCQTLFDFAVAVRAAEFVFASSAADMATGAVCGTVEFRVSFT